MDELEQNQTTRPKPFIFILMPFNKDFERIYSFIQNACALAGAHAERVDKQMFEKSIMEQIYNQIAKADIIVADMTGRNPNVFYEVGYAHALGKRTILLTQAVDDIPFDLRIYRHIVYGRRGRTSREPLLDQLPKWIEWAIAHPDVPLRALQIQLEVQSKRLAGKPVIDVISTGKQRADLNLILNLENSSKDVIRVAEFKLALETSNRLSMMRASQASRGAKPVGYSTSTISREAQTQIHLIREKFTLMPGEWESLKLELAHQCHDGAKEEVVFRVLTDSGEQSYPCILKIGM